MSERKKYWVGCPKSAKHEVFTCSTTPTAELFPQFSSCVGPFRTKRAAEWVANNPMCTFDSIAHAERLAKQECTNDV